MSLRPMLFAARLEPLMSAVQSRDVSLVPIVVDWFRTHLRDPQPSTLDMVRAETEKLLGGNISGGAESEDHVHIVSALATVLNMQVSPALITDDTWKQGAWNEYLEGVRAFLDPITEERLGQLALCKRPLFGSSINTSWSYYGYLFNGEVRELMAGLDELAHLHSEIRSPSFVEGFHFHLASWLRAVDSRAADLWLFAS